MSASDATESSSDAAREPTDAVLLTRKDLTRFARQLLRDWQKQQAAEETPAPTGHLQWRTTFGGRRAVIRGSWLLPSPTDPDLEPDE